MATNSANMVQHQQTAASSVVQTRGAAAGGGAGSGARFIIDLDAKFGNSFHNVTEFPAPSPFTRFEKSYPSRNIKATTGMFDV